MSELSTVLRAWRNRVTPAEVGLPAGDDRRSPGLRREELAALAALSVEYVVQLEQGRARNPSPQVLAALARALRLNAGERDLLYLSAGAAPPADGTVSAHLSPGLQRILDRLGDTPVGVYSAAWDFVHSNRLWEALFGPEPQRTGRDANLVWRAFVRSDIPIVWSPGEAAAFGAEMVADLHAAEVAYPFDRDLAQLIADLREQSPDFLKLWDEWRVGRRTSERKIVDSPAVGPITLDCDVLAATDSDLRLVVYTARPGTTDAEKLDLLRQGR